MSRSFIRAKETLIDLDEAAKGVGLRINETKTKIMTQTRHRTSRGQNTAIGESNIENVDKFTYLGTDLSKNANENEEIKRRLHIANRAYYSVLLIIKSRLIHRKTKIRIYKTIIRPVVCYGCEAWTLTQTSEKMMNVFERKILRRILGPIKDRDGWRIRYNKELYIIYDKPEISTVIKLQRLQWTGHVQQMEDIRIPKKVLKERVCGTRLRGKPRKNWEDSVDADSISLLDLRNWRTRALDQEDWGQCIREAKARYGL